MRINKDVKGFAHYIEKTKHTKYLALTKSNVTVGWYIYFSTIEV